MPPRRNQPVQTEVLFSLPDQPQPDHLAVNGLTETSAPLVAGYDGSTPTDAARAATLAETGQANGTIAAEIAGDVSEKDIIVNSAAAARRPLARGAVHHDMYAGRR